MARIFSNRLITSIDIGTTKICVFIAHQSDDNSLEIIGIGNAPSDGLKKGVVVDIARTVQSMKASIKEAETMAGVSIESAHIGISGGHIISTNSHGVVPIKKERVRMSDISHVLAAAQAIPIDKDYQILHVLPQYFIIDSRERVTDPLDMHGIRLEVQAHIIMGAVASVQNLVNCCQMAGVHVDSIVLEQLASADAVLSKDERHLGIAVLDIGGGTSDLAIYQYGNIRHTMVLPVAGNHFTHDIALGIRTTIDEAERIKKKYGIACFDLLEKNELIEVKLITGNDLQIIRTIDLVHILHPRAHEVLTLIHNEVVKHNLVPFMQMGLVITGGGSLLNGMVELAEQIFNVPVRIGSPKIEFNISKSLNSPIYATGYGLLIHALKNQKNRIYKSNDPLTVKRIFESMKSWVADFF